MGKEIHTQVATTSPLHPELARLGWGSPERALPEPDVRESFLEEGGSEPGAVVEFTVRQPEFKTVPGCVTLGVASLYLIFLVSQMERKAPTALGGTPQSA